MIKDYSQLPANKRIVNDKDEDITISLRDKCIMVPVTIKVNESLSVKATTSEDLALINKQCEEFELPLEDEGPDITDIVVTITPNIREGEDNSKANATIATLSLKGGTEPVEYTLSGTDADKFILENNIVKAKNDLVEGTYSITLSALDSTKETYSETDEINVLAAYPLITDATISFESDIREGESNAAVGSVVGTIQVVGGTEPFVYTLSGTDESSFIIDNASVKVGSAPLTEKTYSITIAVEDANGKTFSAPTTIEVQAAYPEITNVTLSKTPNLREGESNVNTGATVATLTSVGGTQPFTYTISGTDASSFVIAENKLNVGSNPLTAKTYSIEITSTDKNNKTKTVSDTIVVQAAYPEITSFTVSPTGGLEEGNANVQADAVVATMSVEGGSAPITYSFKEDAVNGADNASFKIDGANLKVKETPLVTKEYKVSLTATDTHGKTKDQNATISVAAPNITSLNAQLTSGLEEGNENVAANAKIADLSTTGGIAPYTYSLNTDEVNGVDNANFKVEGTQLKVNTTPLVKKDYKVSLKVTDKNNKTATKNITVSVGTPAISALNITPVESLQAPLAENTVVANLSSVGGIAPYTYSLKPDTQDNAEFTIEGTTVKNIASIDTAGTKNITVVVTDKNSSTKEQTAQIEISAASE